MRHCPPKIPHYVTGIEHRPRGWQDGNYGTIFRADDFDLVLYSHDVFIIGAKCAAMCLNVLCPALNVIMEADSEAYRMI
jgi:hypothetical protein